MKYLIYYFWTFILGNIIGVLIETIWCIIKYKKIESRKGLIYGPFNPLYGFAGLVLTLAIDINPNKSIGTVFITGVVIASIIEYLCSFFQEKAFGVVSWDYKDFKYNLNGRINLFYSIAWGLITILWYFKIMNIVSNIMPFVSAHLSLTLIVLIFYIIDAEISLVANIRRKKRKEKIYPKTKFEKSIDIIYNDERMEKVYPNSIFVEK